jgi:hypothetical protein
MNPKGRYVIMWGWKTIAGGLLVSLGQMFQQGPDPFPLIGNVLLIIGPALFGVGVAHKFTKLANGGFKK